MINLVGVNVVHVLKKVFASTWLKNNNRTVCKTVEQRSRGKMEQKTKRIALAHTHSIINCELHSFDSCLMTDLIMKFKSGSYFFFFFHFISGFRRNNKIISSNHFNNDRVSDQAKEEEKNTEQCYDLI